MTVKAKKARVKAAQTMEKSCAPNQEYKMGLIASKTPGVTKLLTAVSSGAPNDCFL